MKVEPSLSRRRWQARRRARLAARRRRDCGTDECDGSRDDQHSSSAAPRPSLAGRVHGRGHRRPAGGRARHACSSAGARVVLHAPGAAHRPARRRRRTARRHQGARSTSAAGHHGRHHRDRLPRLGRGRRRLGARRGPARRAGRRGSCSPAGPKVTGAIRAAGLTEEWSPASESMAEVLERLLDEGVEGRRIAVQLHGEPLPGFVESLTGRGPRSSGCRSTGGCRRRTSAPLDRLSTDAVSRAAWTRSPSPAPPPPRPCSRRADERGLLRRAAAALRGHDVLSRLRRAGHGAAAAGAGRRHGAAGTLPARPAGASCSAVNCPARARSAAGRRPPARDPRARGAGRRRPAAVLPPAGMALLRALARRPGLGRLRAPSCCARCPARGATSTPSRRPWPGCVRRWASRS